MIKRVTINGKPYQIGDKVDYFLGDHAYFGVPAVIVGFVEYDKDGEEIDEPEYWPDFNFGYVIIDYDVRLKAIGFEGDGDKIMKKLPDDYEPMNEVIW